MGVLVAYVARRNPAHQKRWPAHAMVTADPLPDQGDPFPNHVVRYGDFYQQGKIHADPGVNMNVYTNVPQLQSIAQKFFGQIVSKLAYPKHITTPYGGMGPLGPDVNVETPDSSTYGDFATVDGWSRDRIHTGIQ